MSLMLAIVATMLALLAEPPANPAFTELLASTVVVSRVDGFVGLEWRCYPDDDERCYAGFVGLDVVVGP